MVWVTVLGEDRGRYYTRADGGLVGELLHFMSEVGIHSAGVGGITSGGGMLSMGFTAEDAERVGMWLRQHGAKQVRA